MLRLLLPIFLIFPFCCQAQIITTYAGGGSVALGDGGLAENASLGFFGSIAFDSNGNLFIADGNRHRVRKVDKVSNIITTYAGNGVAGFNGDGSLATNAQLNYPTWITFDKDDNLFIVDAMNRRIRKVSPSGTINTYAGNGTIGYSGDGAGAIAAQLNLVQGIACNSVGDLLIVESNDPRIRKVDHSTQVITTIAGNGSVGFSGDNGSALSATFAGPYGICVDKYDNIFVADNNNARVRKIDILSGIITTYAGNGSMGDGGDGGLAVNAEVGPLGISFDTSGVLYIGDYENHKIRSVSSSGLINSVAGNGIGGFNGDSGLATAAQIKNPQGVAIDLCGNLFIADYGNKRVRKVTFNDTCIQTSVSTVISNKNEFNLFPNPANTYLTITVENLQSITITNTLGQIVHSQKAILEKTVVDISALNTGVYFVTVTDKQGVKVTKKVVKE